MPVDTTSSASAASEGCRGLREPSPAATLSGRGDVVLSGVLADTDHGSQAECTTERSS